MQFSIRHAFILFLFFTLASCSNYHYINSVPPAPMLIKEDEGFLTIYPSYKHVELQFAYSPVNKFAINSSLFAGFDGGIGGDIHFLRYHKITRNDIDRANLFLDYGAGIGIGRLIKTKIYYPDLFIRIDDTNYNLFYFRPTLSADLYWAEPSSIPDAFFKFGLGANINFVHYSVFELNYFRFSDERLAYTKRYSANSMTVLPANVYLQFNIPVTEGQNFVFQAGVSFIIKSTFHADKYSSLEKSIPLLPNTNGAPRFPNFLPVMLNFGYKLDI